MDLEIFLVQNLEIFTKTSLTTSVKCLPGDTKRWGGPSVAVNMDPPTLNSQINPSPSPGLQAGGTTHCLVIFQPSVLGVIWLTWSLVVR